MLRVDDPFEGWNPPSQQEMQSHAREAQEAALEHLAERVRADAAVTPGWEAYGEKAAVYGDDDGDLYLGLDPDDEDNQKYFDLEYGTEDTAPTGFLRNSLDRHHREAAGTLMDELGRRAIWGQ